MTELRRVLIMAGGTGGHVVPALSLAKALQDRGVTVEWLGSPRGIENRLVPAAGIALHQLDIAGLRGNGLSGWLAVPWRLTRAVLQARRVIRRFEPQLVVGLGGFASGPGGLAARLCGRPLMVHEQNAIAGLTNRSLSRLATRTYAAFPGAFPDDKALVVGNPVRAEIAALGERVRTAQEMTGRRLHLLVMGGSLGAQSLNEKLPLALATLDADARPLVRHQAGRDKDEKTSAAYRDAGVDAEVSAFIDDMAEAYDWADLIVCRAGALTIAELSAAGKPSLLVPFPHAVDDHQTLNARHLVDAGGAELVQQSALTPARLEDTLKSLLRPERLASMAVDARRVAHLDAVDRLVDGCMEIGLER
ncbi:undecaprenyldiphospho-muramoylpentapeptide beta-N-acetylglucosaminyltransferase [Salinicola rhizosphaerae]|uniref:UDP-N-acetylglucosamine--N-acetylmuramyl-(pentapeptide) pyrophosphoryl-undecaprenol N-acetylglucosamine transferase n=1 Tax=Salinicola rhizosphaerae TaxID=1443141 RepID=A0ABQ3E9T7_9GAMM|nr:undecaprenyldiphospho-muramoylpentapeptide beta-N-acetylglucosaminyltransferase [Salinicola rhizosphaerae]GHB30961.1 UDP-N-acetylglucosamine--N-acetylmuramyl-(pentapeptide) pyrophosphoryl-undecaprenol N-acetylglucosamine transferase [Salinicola rhizosphaerae]